MSSKIRLPVTAPFQLDATVGLLRRRPANQIERWEEGKYRRVLATPDGARLVTIGNHGSRDAPDLWLTVSGGPIQPQTQRDLVAMARNMLGLDLPPPPLADLVALFPRLASLATRLAGFRPPVFPSLFETAAAVLPFQQLSLDAGVAILNRLAAGFGPTVTIDNIVQHGLPAPAAILAAREDELRRIGLSRSKATALRALAEEAATGILTQQHFALLPTPEASRQLQSVRGIGPWSAGLMLLRGLRRLDVFPPGDVGATRSLARLLDLPAPITPTEAVAIAADAGPLQGYLYYLCLGQWLIEHGLIGESGNDGE